ncbi:MAG: hypothetical protein HY918_02725 [Candidatus Doudnabacteria bacterium]|nr:hypothetical protein [Candidatus Doudnabacteria bacterium]
MLYFLLGLIAVGVLLASQDGKELLSGIFILALIAGGLYVGFWVIMIIIGLLSDKSIREALSSVLSFVGILFLVGYFGFLAIYLIHKKHKQGELKKEAIIKKAKDFWSRNWTRATTKNRLGLICAIFLIMLIIFTWVIVPLFLT